MARSTNRLLAATVGALLVVGLAGCSSDDDVVAGSNPSASLSGEPSVEPSPTKPVIIAPERPAGLDADGPQGAEAAAKYFLELDSYMQATGDTAEWERMSHPSCEFCANRLEQARQIAAEHAVFTGGTTQSQVLHTYEQDPSTGVWPLDIRLHDGATKITSAAGVVEWEQEQTVSDLSMELAQRDGEWLVVGVANVESQAD